MVPQMPNVGSCAAKLKATLIVSQREYMSA